MSEQIPAWIVQGSRQAIQRFVDAYTSSDESLMNIRLAEALFWIAAVDEAASEAQVVRWASWRDDVRETGRGTNGDLLLGLKHARNQVVHRVTLVARPSEGLMAPLIAPLTARACAWTDHHAWPDPRGRASPAQRLAFEQYVRTTSVHGALLEVHKGLEVAWPVEA